MHDHVVSQIGVPVFGQNVKEHVSSDDPDVKMIFFRTDASDEFSHRILVFFLRKNTAGQSIRLRRLRRTQNGISALVQPLFGERFSKRRFRCRRPFRSKIPTDCAKNARGKIQRQDCRKRIGDLHGRFIKMRFVNSRLTPVPQPETNTPVRIAFRL